MLVMCAECSAEISDKASSCPKCGNPITVNSTTSTPGGGVELKVQVSGLTEKAREKSLKKLQSKYEKKGGRFVRYQDGGMGTSYVYFEMPKGHRASGKLGRTVGSMVVLLFIGWCYSNLKDASDQAGGSVAAAPQNSQQLTFVDETCSQVSKMFGPSSKLSDLQKSEHWKAYDGKAFKWRLRVTEVSADTFGGFTVQFKCAHRSPSLIQDLQLKYDESAKSFVVGLEKGKAYEIQGVLDFQSTLLGMSGKAI